MKKEKEIQYGWKKRLDKMTLEGGIKALQMWLHEKKGREMRLMMQLEEVREEREAIEKELREKMQEWDRVTVDVTKQRVKWYE